MTRTMKLAMAEAAAVLVFGLGFGIAAAATWNHDRYQGMNGMPGSMMSGGMMSSSMMSGSMMNGSMMSGGQMGTMMGGAWTGGQSAPPAIADAREVTVTTDELRFSPSTITVKTGEAVNIVLVNSDDIVHDFTVPAFGIHVTLQPGQRTTIGMQPATAGSYPFLCTVAGHAQAGMQGTIVVSS